MTEWKFIKDTFGKYKISNNGEVISFFGKKTRSLKPILLKNGYHAVSLQKGSKVERHYVHRLVASHFIKGSGIVNHKDGNKINNSFRNLEWVTYSQNCKHAWDNGLISKSKRYVLSSRDVDRIRGLYALGLNPSQISRCLHTPTTPTYWVCQLKTWVNYKIDSTNSNIISSAKC